MTKSRLAMAAAAAVGVLVATWAVVLLPQGFFGAEEATAVARDNDVLADGGGVSNVSFYYGGRLDFATDSAETLRAGLGEPAVVVTTRSRDEAATAAGIHRMGAKAYRYIQFYWSPSDRDYDGLDLGQRPDLAYCREGTTPSGGSKETSAGEQWLYLDANEKAVREHFRAKMATLAAQGWDGVFVDRGEAATRYAEDQDGVAIWHRASSCTEEPHEPGATYSDAFVSLIGIAHETGLDAMMNNGKSPFDPVAPMRPDPGDPDCQAHRWPACRVLGDVWPRSDLILNETASRPKDQLWQRTFVGNQRAERHAGHGRRTVALITTSTLGGAAAQTRHNVFYSWSRVKLFDLAVGVNTGDGGCRAGAAVCNQYGTYPELSSIEWGAPRRTGPTKAACLRGSKIRCIWARHYVRGVNVLNASPKRRPARSVGTGTASCRHVYDVQLAKPLAGNRCVRTVKLDLRPWSGRPLLLSVKRW